MKLLQVVFYLVFPILSRCDAGVLPEKFVEVAFVYKTKLSGDLLHLNLAVFQSLLNQLGAIPADILSEGASYFFFEQYSDIVGRIMKMLSHFFQAKLLCFIDVLIQIVPDLLSHSGKLPYLTVIFISLSISFDDQDHHREKLKNDPGIQHIALTVL